MTLRKQQTFFTIFSISFFALLSFTSQAEVDTSIAQSLAKFNSLHRSLNQCRLVDNKDSVIQSWNPIFGVQLKNIVGEGRRLVEKTKEKLVEEINGISCDLSNFQRDVFTEELATIAQGLSDINPARTLPQFYQESNYNQLLADSFLFETPSHRVSCDDLDVSTLSAQDLNSRQVWHQILISYGFNCTVKKYRQLVLAQTKNREAQDIFNDLEGSDNRNLDLSGLKIYIVPHFGYERGEYKLFLDRAQNQEPLLGVFNPEGEVEKLSYYVLRDHLIELGAQAKILDRTTNESLDKQIEQTYSQIANETEDYIIISRSAGSHIVHGMLKQRGVPSHLKAWFNVGGTPRGSTIPEEVNHDPNIFFADVVPTMLPEFFKAKMAALAPVPDDMRKRLMTFVDHSLDYQNSIQLGLSQKLTDHSNTAENNWAIPVVNLNFMVKNERDIHRRDNAGDRVVLPPPFASMSKWGVSEMSSLFADAAIDTPSGVRIMVNDDHYFFANHSEEEGLSLYRQLLKTAQRKGLL